MNTVISPKENVDKLQGKKENKPRICETLSTPCYDNEKMSQVLKEVGVRIKKERLRQQLSVAELGELAKLNTTNIYRIEDGSINVGLKSLLKISIVLKRPINEFVPVVKVEDPIGNGEKFEKMTRDLNLEEINFVFDFVENLIDLKTSVTH